MQRELWLSFTCFSAKVFSFAIIWLVNSLNSAEIKVRDRIFSEVENGVIANVIINVIINVITRNIIGTDF